MKKLIILLLLTTSSIFSQGWNDVILTSIPFDLSTGSEMDQCTNKNGIHILIDQEEYSGASLKYYLLNSLGSVVRYCTFENQSVEFASIDGNNDKIYAVYKLGNQIKTRKSTDAGQNWTNNIANISIGNNECSNVDIIWSKYDNALHVTWATRDNENFDETYYKRLPSSDQWDATETVTNYGDEVGGYPTVSVSQDRVHFSYSNFSAVKAMTRDKYLSTSQWQNPQVAFNGQSFRERVQASTSKLFDFYYKLEGGMGNYHSDLYVTERSLSGTTWSSGTLLHSFAGIEPVLSSTNTVDGKSHIVYEGSNSVVYRSYNGTTWSSEFTIGESWIFPKISSASNDLFVAWGKYINDHLIYYRQYDAIPIAPQNLAVEIYTEGGQTYPKLTWLFNNEPDVFIKANAYQVWRRYCLSGGEWSAWFVVGYSDGDENQYIDYTISGLYAEANTAEYKIKARDYTNYFSDYSSSVSINFSKLGKINTDNELSYDYELNQNYPNPFNPKTMIDYSIKSAGLVTLKVYDMLGTEVVSLVNELKDAGNYSVTFNASYLPSGIYFYNLISGNFMATKKLILLK